MYNYVYNNPKSMYIPVIGRDTIMYVCVCVCACSFISPSSTFVYLFFTNNM